MAANATNTPTVTLMDFLQNDPNPFRYYFRSQTDRTTTNEAFRVSRPATVHDWFEFNLDTIIAQFGDLLQNVRVAMDAHPATPCPPFAAEDGLREHIATYADRPVRRALARTFAHMAAAPGNQWPGRSETTLGAGSSAILVSDFVPDRAMYDPNVDASVNRLPGEIKPSWKWKRAWLMPDSSDRGKCLDRLSQLTFYMLQQGYQQPQHSGARYGYMLTDREMVAIRKDDAQRTVSVSRPVPWAGRGEGGQPRLTVLLALWYLGMLASDNNDWNIDAQPGDPEDALLLVQVSRRQAGSAAQAARRR